MKGVMILFKLEKNITLYRQQYEEFMMDVYGSYRIDRISMDLDAVLFRVKYMERHGINTDEMKPIFKQHVYDLKTVFADYAYKLLKHKLADVGSIDDIMVNDVKLDQNYVKFQLSVLSEDEEYLKWVDGIIPDEKPLNIFPEKYFRFFTDSYNDGIAKAYPELFQNRQQDIIGTGADKDIFVHSLTFQTTERCSLSCTYCYQFAKSEMRMSFDTAKEFIDKLLNDEYGYINRYNSPAIIIEFIGGEPLLEINRTREIYEYFLDRCYELNHPWFTMHRLSICSNGMQYFNDNVQDFFKTYASQISFNISIDGNKELHDACRKQPNGEGSYDIDMMALNHFATHYSSERNSKMTLAPSNIGYLFDSVVDFINHGMTVINLNCVFEEGWQPKHAKIEYDQLKKLADYLLDNDLEHLYIGIFNERQEDMMDKDNDSSFCGGQGSMLALRPNGEFYPCIRYMPTSVGPDRDSYCIGTVHDGMDSREDNSPVLNRLDHISRRGQTNDICYECPLSNDCASCLALGLTVFNNPNKRTTFSCIMVIAEALANVYYWNLVAIKHPEWHMKPRHNVVPKEWALLVIDEQELQYLYMLELIASIQYYEK